MFSQFFIHPAMAAGGLALVSIPVIIHLINRLRYRKVRFAAMEFLLQSQQQNRRRILIEQLLLLLLRILIVLFIVALFARLLLDPSQLAMLEKPQTHHLIVLDDSGSMRDRWGETTAYGEALGTLKKLTSQLSNQAGLQTMTLMQTSQPDRTASNFTQRQIDVSLLSELEDKLETMQRECRFGTTNWSEVFTAIQRNLEADPDQQQVVHLLSDYRAGEWGQSPSMPAELESLAESGVLINLVPVVPLRHDNIAVTRLTGDVHTAAVDVPLSLTVDVANFGENVAEEIALRVLVDGEPIPQTITIPNIEAGDTVQESFEVVLTTPGEHAIAVQIPADALTGDNSHFLTLDVPERQRVLLVDGTEQSKESLYIADALAADPSVTGIEVVIIRPDNLVDQALTDFSAVYLMNISELSPPTLSLMKDYVKQGGGVAWFLGDRTNAAAYRQMAEENEEAKSLFPVPLALSPVRLDPANDDLQQADLVLSDHPVFAFLTEAEGLLANFINIYQYYELEGTEIPQDVQVIGRLRNQAPLFLQSQLGEGLVFISLTSAGPMSEVLDERWHNWPFDINAPGYTVFHLELVKYLGSRQGVRSAREIEEPLLVEINPAIQMPEIRIEPPTDSGLSAVNLTATLQESDSADPASSQQLLQAEFRDTFRPGVYRLTTENQAREASTTLIAYNVPTQEGQLELTTPEELRGELAGIEGIIVQNYDELVGIERDDPGRELRLLLLLLLVVLFIAEQALAYKLSYHDLPESRGRKLRPRFLRGGRLMGLKGLRKPPITRTGGPI